MSQTSLPAKERKNWIDWMKVLGMFFIVWGHSWPESMCPFIYAFNVPVFFLISGYLSKREDSFRTFWRKSWYNLLVPYLIICTVKRLGLWIGHIDDGETWWSILGVLTGFHSVGEIPACTMMWFVATLFFVKLFFQLWGERTRNLLILSLVSIALSILYNHSGANIAWSLTNVPLAMPYFLLGHACATTWKNPFDRMCRTILGFHKAFCGLGILILFAAIYLLAPFNEPGLEMFKAEYGRSFLLATLLGLAGSLAVLMGSLLLDKVTGKALRMLSAGTIVILGFHRDIANPLEKPLEIFSQGSLEWDGGTFFVSILVMLAFIPIIWLVKRFLPFLLGKRSF